MRTRRLAACLALPCGAALAQPVSAPPPAPQAAPAVRRFDIPPGPLSRVLTQLAVEANLLLAVDAGWIAELQSPGVRGAMGVRDAFAVALQDTGFEAVPDGTRYTLRRRREEARLATLVVRPGDGVGYAATDATGPLRTRAPLRETPQSVTVVTDALSRDQAARGLADVMRWVPGVVVAQGEGNRDALVFRGNATTADFLLDGLRDDAQYYRDLYHVDRVEALRGPNAVAVGPGAAGGVVNRITKMPEARRGGDLTLQAGAWDAWRTTVDAQTTDGEGLSARVNGMLEDSGGFRDTYFLRRQGVAPTVAWRPDGATRMTFGVEHFEDERRADRGIPSWQGRPADVPPEAFVGIPAASTSRMHIDAATWTVDHEAPSGLGVRSRTRYARHEKFFQNVFAGPVRQGTGGLEVALLAHNARTARTQLSHQTDVSVAAQAFGWRHDLTLGLDLNGHRADNRRETGTFFGDPARTVVFVPLSAAQVDLPVSFATRATDIDNRARVNAAGLGLHDRVTLGPQWQLHAGLRHDRIETTVDDRRLGRELSRSDRLWSPRFALVHTPSRIPSLSVYLAQGVAHVPRAGDQFSSLTPSNQALAPERVRHHEVGAKWAVRPGLDATVAAYHLRRRGVAVADPAAPGRTVLADDQRTRGIEASLAGQAAAGVQVMGGYAYQASRVAGGGVGAVPTGAATPHVPRHAASLWGRIALGRPWAAGLGAVYRARTYTSADNTVVLPSFVRLDGAVYWQGPSDWRAQLNVENLLDTRYAASAHSNSNISPGTPRSWRLTVTRFF